LIRLSRITGITCLLLVLTLLAPTAVVQANGYTEQAQGGIDVSAPAAIAVDTATGQVVYEKNADD